MKNVKLAIVVPCYNEEEVIRHTDGILQGIISEMIQKGTISKDSFVCYVNDGSTDGTWVAIEELNRSKHVRGLKLSTNFGHQNALFAGLMYSRDLADCIISIDADLQDDVNVIEEMVAQFANGFDIVYGVRNSRTTDSFLKRNTALLFYKIMHALKVRSVYNHADFRLVSARALAELSRFKEVNLYLRSMFPLLGFQSAKVFYDRKPREAGETKYPLKKMIAFAWDGITSFSIFPVRMMFGLGVIIFVLSFFLSAWALYLVISGISVPGWASIVIPIFVLGGLQMISIGLLGEYIGKIYQEVKSRPRYIIEKEIK